MIERIVITLLMLASILFTLGVATVIYRSAVADNRKLAKLQYTSLIGVAICFIAIAICGIIAMWI